MRAPRALTLLALLAVTLGPGLAWGVPAQSAVPWWAWPLGLFVTAFLIGIIAVVGGIGGGVLFVPIVGGFFPFHLDFVRGAGLLLALCGALAAGPGLLKCGLASLRLAMPLALVGSVSSIVGALIGLALPTHMVQTALGVVILMIALLIWVSRISDQSNAGPADSWGRALRLQGMFFDVAADRDVNWKARRTPAGIAAFAGIGLIGGMFGLGAGWANVPALNLLMGVPFKLAVGTSTLAISIINTSAAWVYLNRGALLPILFVPSILGVMVGARLGSQWLQHMHASTSRRIMLAVLVVAGVRALSQGLGLWN